MLDGKNAAVDDLGGQTANAGEPVRWTGTSPLGREWEVQCATANEAVRNLPPSSINCVVTSPPYFWLRDYGVDGQIGLEDSVEAYADERQGGVATIKTMFS
ncbi:MAG: site-specific DNA-methyltransferase [Sphingomonas bacterium]|nr:site-specific DNA-methyltransferase [Sphingomonas bacterium]